MLYLKKGKELVSVRGKKACYEFFGCSGEPLAQAKIDRAINGELFTIYGYAIFKTKKAAEA